MENLSFLLKKRHRRIGFDCLHFFETLSLYLQVGYDLSYSWPEALNALSSELHRRTHSLLLPNGEEGVSPFLSRLSKEFPIRKYRMWFSVLRELYSNGAGLSEGVSSIAATLRADYEREMELHVRNLPTKVNILLLLFFLPPTFILIFTPLLVEIISGIAE